MIAFAHDTEGQRYKQTAPSGEILYLAASGVSTEKFTGAGGVVQWTNYLQAGGETIGMRVERSDGGLFTRHYHKDHLGSTAALSNENGAIVESLAYGPWGKRRFPGGQDDPSGSLSSQTTRGFTGQEQLAEVGLVHMNGRVYDPVIGRFGSPDPLTPDLHSTQSWNRYSYAANNPLKYVDPTGHEESDGTSWGGGPFNTNTGGIDGFTAGSMSTGGTSQSPPGAANNSVGGGSPEGGTAGGAADAAPSMQARAPEFSPDMATAPVTAVHPVANVIPIPETSRDGAPGTDENSADPGLGGPPNDSKSKSGIPGIRLGTLESYARDAQNVCKGMCHGYDGTPGRDMTSGEELGLHVTAFVATFAIVGLASLPGKVIAGGELAAEKAGIVANGIRGRASEARVLQKLGLTKNTKAVSTAEGQSVPDALTKSLSVEVKDRAKVSFTKQLRIQTEAARAAGRESVLVTGEGTRVTGPVSRAFDQIVRRPDLGPQ